MKLSDKVLALAKTRAYTHRVTLRLDPLYYWSNPHFGKADVPFKIIPFGPDRSWLYDQMTGRLLRPWNPKAGYNSAKPKPLSPPISHRQPVIPHTYSP